MYPTIAIDGIPLDDTIRQRWMLSDTQSLRSVPARRTTSIIVPGRSGALRPLYEPHTESTFTVTLHVYGHGATVEARRIDLESNLDQVFFLVNRDVVNLQYSISQTETRVAGARLETASDPLFTGARTEATVTLVFNIPDGVWRDQDEVIWDAQHDPGVPELLSLNGSTAPCRDAKFLIQGPFTRCRITDEESKQNLLVVQNVGASQWVLVDCEPMKATLEGGASWDHIGLDITSSVYTYGANSATSWMNFYPRMIGNPDVRRCYYRVSYVGGSNSNLIKFRTRRAYAS